MPSLPPDHAAPASPASPPPTLRRRLSVAPMMDWTSRDFRYLCRLITRHTLLYTEMVTAPAIIHGHRDTLLGFDALEHPVAVQLGGSDPAQLAEAARICADYGYDEVNLNVGCPSDRVQSGRFGACLMADPGLVAECVAAMAAAVSLPVTVKSRIGIDDQDDYAFLHTFVDTVRQAGCRSFTIHARKAILAGLSPKENRDIPPLVYERAYAIKQDFPDCEIIINGGIRSLDAVREHLDQVDGVMIGREAYMNPWFLRDADPLLFDTPAPCTDRHSVIEAFLPYVEQRYAQGVHPKHVLRHVLNLFQGIPGARAFRRHLSTRAHLADATPEVLLEALRLVPR
ncbi:tRNA dihydrouridine(20/20a) synthase DusA [Alcanivorax sp. JB21]|uniref:tRNA dihydrouridine(20/20a) synthase DusA n=1 Tax=Alcanivorax limicola TaxID=2874102 RepID=UPI001CBB9594|nr:tRNA dihydrouridine(20/20a) synthase DusA [Alcanivorax limicola]MBZ2187619.1 tRNA dihydrouridine(20/20a) synthase DusA [Alcanivorax limicola]